jgi:hypothetical protein
MNILLPDENNFIKRSESRMMIGYNEEHIVGRVDEPDERGQEAGMHDSK